MIASIGPGLPTDLLAATGRYAGTLEWEVAHSTPRADEWLESKYPLWARAILEQWAAGAYDWLDTVVFSRADDAAQRLYYYICELQRQGLVAGPRALIMDIAKVPRTSSEARTIAAVRQLAEEFGLDDAALEQGIARTNEQRRAARPEPDSASPVCLVIGTPPLNDAMHRAVVRAGFRPEGQILDETWSDPGPLVEEGSADPAAAIGRQVHARQDDQRGFSNVTHWVLDRARSTNARAAVQWYAEEDESRVWDAPAVNAALASAGIPTLFLARRDAAAHDGAPKEIENFLKEIQS